MLRVSLKIFITLFYVAVNLIESTVINARLCCFWDRAIQHHQSNCGRHVTEAVKQPTVGLHAIYCVIMYEGRLGSTFTFSFFIDKALGNFGGGGTN